MWSSIPAPTVLLSYADISIDASTPETYAVNRRGGRFEVLLRNLEFITSLRRDGPLTWLGINMVVQENNFEEMAGSSLWGRNWASTPCTSTSSRTGVRSPTRSTSDGLSTARRTETWRA